MAQTLYLDGTFTEETAAGTERMRFDLEETLSVTERADHRQTYTANQADTAVSLGAVAAVTGVIIYNHSYATESITVKINGSATALKVGQCLIWLGSSITSLSFSWTKVTANLDLEVVMFG